MVTLRCFTRVGGSYTSVWTWAVPGRTPLLPRLPSSYTLWYLPQKQLSFLLCIYGFDKCVCMGEWVCESPHWGTNNVCMSA